MCVFSTLRRFHGCTALSKIGGVVVQSPLLAIREYEMEHGIPDNYINCLM